MHLQNIYVYSVLLLMIGKGSKLLITKHVLLQIYSIFSVLTNKKTVLTVKKAYRNYFYRKAGQYERQLTTCNYVVFGYKSKLIG